VLMPSSPLLLAVFLVIKQLLPARMPVDPLNWASDPSTWLRLPMLMPSFELFFAVDDLTRLLLPVMTIPWTELSFDSIPMTLDRVLAAKRIPKA